MAEHNLEGAKDAEQAALITRAAKQERDPSALRTEWQARANEQGYDLQSVVASAQAARGQQLERAGSSQSTAREGVEFAVAHLSERQSIFPRHEIVRHALQQTTGEATLGEVRQALQQAEKSGAIIKVHDDQFTTFSALKAEREMVWTVKDGMERVVPISTREQVAQGLEGRALTAGQQEAAMHVLTTTDRFAGIEGKAGTGKTTMLAVVREQAESQGFELRGLAPTAAAARVLEEQAHVKSNTVSSYLSGQASTLAGNRNTVYVIDESSMLSTSQAHALVHRITQEQARAVFLGDRQQLSAIEAGKPYAVMVDRAMTTASMTEIVRQKDGDLRSAVESTVQGRVTEALHRLDQQGQVMEIPDRDTRLATIAQTYLELAGQDRGQALVLTGSRFDQRELNSRIREGLKQQGQLIGDPVQGEVLLSKNMTKAMASQISAYEVGDSVRFGKADQQAGIEMNEYGKVSALHPEAGTVSLTMGDNRQVTWNPGKASRIEVYRSEAREIQAGDTIRWTRNDAAADRRNGELAVVVGVDRDNKTATVDYRGKAETVDLSWEKHWEHGYAQTVHSAQGRTAASVVYHIDSSQSALTGKEAWYVAISRARSDVQIVTDDRSALPGAINQSRQQESAIEGVEKGGRAIQQGAKAGLELER
ncbi:MAG: AAA family ATPase [Nitrospira sp.]|nr:AAA family ATPase [Nitrospira sp.]